MKKSTLIKFFASACSFLIILIFSFFIHSSSVQAAICGGPVNYPSCLGQTCTNTEPYSCGSQTTTNPPNTTQSQDCEFSGSGSCEYSCNYYTNGTDVEEYAANPNGNGGAGSCDLTDLGFQSTPDCSAATTANCSFIGYVDPQGSCDPTSCAAQSTSCTTYACGTFYNTTNQTTYNQCDGTATGICSQNGSGGYCGDGICNDGETSISCPIDCGGGSASSDNGAQISLNPKTLTFNSIAGNAPVPSSQNVVLSDIGQVFLSDTATTNQSWCHVYPPASETAVNGTSNLTVSVDSVPTAGNYTCAVTVQDTVNPLDVESVIVNYPVTAAPPPIVNGICGGSNGQSFSSAPASGLCTTGTASAVTGSGPWNWRCAGSNGGTTASCNASVSGTPNQSVCQSFSAPSTVTAGSSFPVTATILNSGTNMWYDQSVYNTPPQDQQFYGFTTINPPSGPWDGGPFGHSWNTLPSPTITTGNTGTFSFNLIAPSTAGVYPLQMQMLQNNIGWFGPVCSENITVVSGSANGVCGTANSTDYGADTSNYGSDTYCSTGTVSPASPAFPMAGSSTSWSCQGTSTNASCQATRSCIATSYQSATSGFSSTPTGSVTHALTVPNNQQYFYGMCDYGAGSNSIWYDNTSGVYCAWYGYNGTQATFQCTTPSTAGTYSFTCGSHTGSVALDACSASSNPSGTVTVTNAGGTPAVCGTSAQDYPVGTVSYPGSTTFCRSGTPSPSSPSFPTPGNPATWVCNSTDGGPNSGPCTATVQGPGDYTLTIDPTIGGTVTSADGNIACGTNCSSDYLQGTVVNLKAIPDSIYWQFEGWTGNCSGSNPMFGLTVNSTATCSAIFAPTPFQYQEF